MYHEFEVFEEGLCQLGYVNRKKKKKKCSKVL